jgi:hypothetical protein
MHIESRLSASVKRCMLPTLIGLILTGCASNWQSEVKSIAITPSNPTVAQGQTLQLTATATLSDGSTRDVTTSWSLYWLSSDKSVAKIDGKGLVTAIDPGVTTITAFLDRGGYDRVYQYIQLTVDPPAIASTAIGPASAAGKPGANQVPASTGTTIDGWQQDVTQSAHWSSTDFAISRAATAAGRVNTSHVALSQLAAGPTVTNACPRTIALDQAGKPSFAAITSPPDGSSMPAAGYLIDATTGTVTSVSASLFLVGEIPLWIVIDPLERILYVGCNIASEASAHPIDPEGGQLTTVPGSPFVTPGPPVFMQVEPSGQVLYIGTDMAGVLGYWIDHASGAPTSRE